MAVKNDIPVVPVLRIVVYRSILPRVTRDFAFRRFYDSGALLRVERSPSTRHLASSFLRWRARGSASPRRRRRPSSSRLFPSAIGRSGRRRCTQGLRRGELLALRWEDVDLAAGVIHVERSSDARRAPSGRRAEPGGAPCRSPSSSATISRRAQAAAGPSRRPRLRDELHAAVHASNVRKRANAAWARAGLQPIRLHECRHTFASLMIAAGVNAKALSAYMGHSSVTIMLDRSAT